MQNNSDGMGENKHYKDIVKMVTQLCVRPSPQSWKFLHGACSHTASSCLNDICCSGNALMWEIKVVCSMWQIIRHANQEEAAVESLITVRVPHKGTSPAHTALPPASCSPRIPRQTDGPEAETLKQWEERRVWGGLGGMASCGPAQGVGQLYVDLGGVVGGLLLFIFGFH